MLSRQNHFKYDLPRLKPKEWKKTYPGNINNNERAEVAILIFQKFKEVTRDREGHYTIKYNKG